MIIWLASYPKSGNTWVRFFLILLLLNNKTNVTLKDLTNIKQFPAKSQYERLNINIDLKNMNEVAKHWLEVQKKINSDNKIRFFKTHNAFCKIDKNIFTNNENTLGTIYIVRDPRNVISSINNHFHHENIDVSKEFIFDENKGIGTKETILPQVIGSWKSHYNSWKQMKKNYLLIKYENLVNSPFSEFKKISIYLEKLLRIKISDEKIEKSIKLASFKRLQNIENKEGFSESRVDEKTGSRKNFFFLGAKNNWQELLDEKTLYQINRKFKKEMKELEYL
tara:strand:+ start:409 stop:1245 length:837 start_codon:yes stop_codon:yes gene_type:complete